MRRINHIFLVLGFAIIFLLTTFLSSWFRDYVFFFTLGFLLLLLLVYWRTKDRYEKYDLYLIMFIFFTFAASRLIFRNLDQVTLVIRTASTLAFFILNLVLLIGPWSRFSDRILKLYHYRRHLGVTVLMLGSLHAVNVLSSYFNYSLNAAFQSIFTFYGFTALFLMFWLGVTSWDYLQKFVPRLWWKILHAVLLAIWIILAYYVYSLQKGLDANLTFHLIFMALIFMFWIMVAPYSIIKKIMRTYVFGWKQLHVLIYVVYFSLLMHVWLGVISFQNVILKIIFWSMAVFVLGSHLAGWIVRFMEDKKINLSVRIINKEFTESGKIFIGVAKVKNFKEGKGKKFYLDGQPIAVFKQGKDFFAISNICAHQKGPLYKGKISNGTVECPWHYWVYDINDGSFLGRENFCLPKYETKVRNGILFVSYEPLNKKKINHP